MLPPASRRDGFTGAIRILRPVVDAFLLSQQAKMVRRKSMFYNRVPIPDVELRGCASDHCGEGQLIQAETGS
jgi:hypothetical protein